MKIRYERTIEEQALLKAERLAKRRKRPYRGKHGVESPFGVIPSYEAPFVFAKRIKAARDERQRLLDKWLRDGGTVEGFEEIRKFVREMFGTGTGTGLIKIKFEGES